MSFTRATFRLAELGFFGLAIISCVTTPFRCGQASSNGDLTLPCFFGTLFARMDWLIVLNVVGETWKERLESKDDEAKPSVVLWRHVLLNNELRAAARIPENIRRT